MEGFKRFCICNGMDGTKGECYAMAVKRLGMLRVSVRKMKALPV